MSLRIIFSESNAVTTKSESRFSTHYFSQNSSQPLGTVRPLYSTGVSLLSRQRFLYI